MLDTMIFSGSLQFSLLPVTEGWFCSTYMAIYPAENHKSNILVSKLLRVHLQIFISNQFTPANISQCLHVITESEEMPVFTISTAIA